MSYFDLTVFNRIAAQQKETNDLLKQLIELMKTPKQVQPAWPPRFSEPAMPAVPSPMVPQPFYPQPSPWPAPPTVWCHTAQVEPQAQWPFPTSPKP